MTVAVLGFVQAPAHPAHLFLQGAHPVEKLGQQLAGRRRAAAAGHGRGEGGAAATAQPFQLLAELEDLVLQVDALAAFGLGPRRADRDDGRRPAQQRGGEDQNGGERASSHERNSGRTAPHRLPDAPDGR